MRISDWSSDVCSSDLPPVAAACSPRHLLQQLNQVQEGLELYYLKCLDLDSELQVARLAGDDAKREIQALRAQLQHMQGELQKAADRTARGVLRRLLSRFNPGRLTQRVRKSRERDHLHAQVEDIRSSSWFDSAWYLDAYPDVRDAGMDPVGHYIEFGWKDAPNPGPLFDTAWSLRAYPDIAASGLNPLWHFVQSGSTEGRLSRTSCPVLVP